MIEDPEADDYDPPEPGEAYNPWVEEFKKGGLSDQEAEVAMWKAKGHTHEKIAGVMDIAESTVDEYSRRIRRKVKKANDLLQAIDESGLNDRRSYLETWRGRNVELRETQREE